MEPSDSTLTRAQDTIQELLAEIGDPSTPLSTAEIADRVGWHEQTAMQHLTTLVDQGKLQTRELQEGTRVWWQSPDRTIVADQQSKLQEFGAFVSAVEDYAIFMLEPDGTVTSWNQGAERIKGYSEGDIIGEHFSTFYTDEAVTNGVPETNLETAKQEGRVEDEGWRVREDGSRFWANVVITAIRDIDGTLQGFTKVTRDMTEQREYELQLRKERDLTEQILETVPVGICVTDTDRDFVRANEQALALLSLDGSDISSRSIENKDLYDGEDALIPPDDRPWTEVIETGQPVSDFHCWVAQSAEGRRWLSINAVPLKGNIHEDDRIVISLEDITDQKQRERRLERRKTELETELSEILGRISDAFFALDEDWQFTHLNDQAETLFQRSEAELSNRSFWDVFPGRTDGELQEQFTEALETQQPTTFELRDDKLDAWLEYRVYPSRSGLSIYIHDITDRREYREKLEESNERLEQFAYAASHDLQEPLRMVSSYLQLIDRRYGEELDEDGREFLEFAVDGADRMRNMIDSLLAYSRVQTRGEPFESVDLDEVLAEVRTDLQRRITETDAEISAGSLPTVEGDASQLHQVFQNLVDNAIEYSGEAPPHVHVSAERNGDKWVISVEDEGIGIDPDESDRIFEVFERLHTRDEYGGTGIGLALCERIIERHNGEIWVESEPGNGSTFSFTLPVAEE